MKRVLITGKTSYIATNLKAWLEKEPDKFEVDLISVRGEDWKSMDFSKYDVVVHAAGIVHRKSNKNEFFKINSDLTFSIAEKARANRVKQFIFLSTMAVYGENGYLNKDCELNYSTIPNPKTNYAKSKFDGEKRLVPLANSNFKVTILRVPMVYGSNCPGNYAKMKRLVKYVNLYPELYNKRSMISISNLNLKFQEYIEYEITGIVLPQDNYYHSTMQILKELGDQLNKKIYFSKLLGYVFLIIFRNLNVIKKMFGNLTYISEEVF